MRGEYSVRSCDGLYPLQIISNHILQFQSITCQDTTLYEMGKELTVSMQSSTWRG